MRIVIEALPSKRPSFGLQFTRLNSEWEVTNVPDWSRANTFIKDAIRGIAGTTDAEPRLFQVGTFPGTLKFKYDPDRVTIETVEKSIHSAIVNACVHLPRPPD